MHAERTGRKDVNGALNDENNGTSNKGLAKYGGYRTANSQVRQLTYLLTPRCRVLLEKLTCLQLVKKFPAFHGTRRLITALTSVCQLSLSWASPIQSIYPHPTSRRTILILSTHLLLGLPSGSFLPVSPPRPYTSPSPQPYAPHSQPIGPASTETIILYVAKYKKALPRVSA